LLLETVILRVASGRTSLCISTQVGCAAKCKFCATGQMGIARNLTRDEILDQVAQANQLVRGENRRVRNLVFMGMGEPLHNETELHAALDVLCDQQGFNYHRGRVLISTVGIPAAMIRLVQRYPEVRLALSLHSARSPVREQLMPLAAHHTLDRLRAALVEIGRIYRLPLMIEYLLLKDLTDTDDDVAALLGFLRGLDVHLNLIPFNAIEGAEHLQPSDERRTQVFSAALKAAGMRVTTRYSLGSDIAAACGQLVRRENLTRGRSADPVVA
jgi:23S rRNA (adenine2503-C2)-methyltransferase